jgi:hypothetical protein
MTDFQDIDGTDAPFLLGFPVASPSGINSGAGSTATSTPSRRPRSSA